MQKSTRAGDARAPRAGGLCSYTSQQWFLRGHGYGLISNTVQLRGYGYGLTLNTAQLRAVMNAMRRDARTLADMKAR